MKTFKQHVTEVFDRPLKYRKQGDIYKFKVKGKEGTVEYNARLTRGDFEFWDEDGDMDLTDIGHKAAIQVFSTIIDILKKIIETEKPKMFTFSASKVDESGEGRSKLYDKFAKMITQKYPYKFNIRKAEEADTFVFKRIR